MCLFIASQACAQEIKPAITLGERQTIESKIMGEQRELLVYTPDRIAPKLPLILVFDGESLFGPTVAAVRFMNYSSEVPQMPEAIVVGIPNTNRLRDMPIPQQYGMGKGENNFMKFIQEELLPYLEKKYPLNGHVISIGHSQGGLFVSYLMSSAPKAFPWVVALDAPMQVDPRINNLKEAFLKTIHDEKNKLRYASVETLYGWDGALPAIKDVTTQVKLPDETHESMPYKGIYEGLSFLYHDFGPARKDMKLSELQAHYRSLSEKYGYVYEIPFRVLTGSASRKMMEGRKAEIMELVNYAEATYAPSERTARLKADAMKITQQAPSVIDSFLALKKPGANEVKNYLGTWKGELVVAGGQNTPVTLEITIENGKPVMRSVLPWPPYKREEPEIFTVSKNGDLVFGRRNRGAGLVITTAKLDKTGHLVGEEWLRGFVIADDLPDDVKKQMKFFMTHPNTFVLVKR